MEWELTDEEISKAIESVEVDDLTDRAVAQAQAKKLVPHIEKLICQMFGLVEQQKLFVFDSPEWQELRRQAGLDK